MDDDKSFKLLVVPRNRSGNRNPVPRHHFRRSKVGDGKEFQRRFFLNLRQKSVYLLQRFQRFDAIGFLVPDHADGSADVEDGDFGARHSPSVAREPPKSKIQIPKKLSNPKRKISRNASSRGMYKKKDSRDLLGILGLFGFLGIL